MTRRTSSVNYSVYLYKHRCHKRISCSTIRHRIWWSRFYQKARKKDREVKFEDYTAHGVAEYWLVDPTRQTVEFFTIDADTEAYKTLGLFRFSETVSSQLLIGFTIPVKAIFDATANRGTLRALLT